MAIALVTPPLARMTSNPDASSYVFPSVTPTSGRLQMIAVQSVRSGATPSQPTLSGCGLTWDAIATVTFNTIASPVSRLTLFRSAGSPSAGVVTITFAETQQDCVGVFWELTGTDVSGSNGSGAIIQSTTNRANSVSTLTVTQAAFASATNGAVSVFAKNGTGTVTPDTGWTEFDEITASSPNTLMELQWRASQDTTAVATWSATDNVGGIAVEISEPLAATGWGHLLDFKRDRLVMA